MVEYDRNIWLNKMKNKESLGKSDCPFCNKLPGEEDLFLYETKYWEVILNKFPYYGKKQNILVVPKRHIEETIEISNEELLDFKNIEIFMKKYFKEKQYISFIRQTDGGRSIKHLHYHYLEGTFFHDIESGQYNFKIKL